MRTSPREWWERHGWEMTLIVVAAVVGKIVDHLW